MTEKKFENHLHTIEKKWFAVYTRYKSEKVVKRFLDNKNIENYLPIQRVTRRYERKIKHLEIPLINCYIFVKIIKPEYVTVLETENVLKFVRIARNLIAIPEKEMELMKLVVGEGKDIEAEANCRVEKGDMVEVIGGRLTGLKGRLVEKQGKKQMIVDLENVGYSLKMNIDVSLLKKIV